MKFLIITHVEHIFDQNKYWAYAPYVREMNIWLKHPNQVTVIAPLVKKPLEAIHENYQKEFLELVEVPAFNLKNFKNIIKTLGVLPKICFTMFKAMQAADHIHLRCPGNMGLIGCLVQIMFPNKPKTAKYAGNWDPNSKQPLSYRIQKWILSQTFLTKNIQVLVYGAWPRQSKNILPFFTASYSDEEILENFKPKTLDKNKTIHFLFVGSLTAGKQPLIAIKLIEQLIAKGLDVSLKIIGDGPLKNELQHYIIKNKLTNHIYIMGYFNKLQTKAAYQNSHFLVLASKSEGWPKAVAEAMFWGCVPIASPVSCVPTMLNNGQRGLLLKNNLEEAISMILELINQTNQYDDMSHDAKQWSQQFTLNKFEIAIKKLI